MFLGNSETKILSWRNFRNNLQNWPDDIEQVAASWAKAPLVNNYLTYEDTKDWPDAWTLIKDGVFCDISIALGMFYTLYYSNYQQRDSMVIECYRDVEKHQILNLVSLEQGKYMLNFHVGRSVNKKELGLQFSPSYTITHLDLPIKI